MVAISAKIKTQTDEELKEELCRLHFTEICESTIEKTVDRGALERAALWAERYQDATKKGHAGFAVKGFSILRWGDTKRGEAFFSLPMSVTAGLLAASAGGGWTLMIAAGLAGQMMGYLVADMDRVKDNVKKEGAGNLKAFAACMRYAGGIEEKRLVGGACAGGFEFLSAGVRGRQSFGLDGFHGNRRKHWLGGSPREKNRRL